MSIILDFLKVFLNIIGYAVAIPLVIFCLFTVASAIVQHFDGVYQKLRGTVRSVFAAPGNWLAKMVSCCWAAALLYIFVGYCSFMGRVLLLPGPDERPHVPSWKDYVCDKPTSPKLPDLMLETIILAQSLAAYVLGAIVFKIGLFLLGLCSAQIEHGGIDTEIRPLWLAEESLPSSREHWRQVKTELYSDFPTEHDYEQLPSQYHSQPTIEYDEQALGPVKDEGY